MRTIIVDDLELKRQDRSVLLARQLGIINMVPSVRVSIQDIVEAIFDKLDRRPAARESVQVNTMLLWLNNFDSKLPPATGTMF